MLWITLIHLWYHAMPRAKKTAESIQPLPKQTPLPPPTPQQQPLQCKASTNTHAVLLGLGALLIASFGVNLSALAANKTTEPTHEMMSAYMQSLETKVDKLQQQLNSLSAQLLKACNDVSTSCIEQTKPDSEKTEETPVTATPKQ